MKNKKLPNSRIRLQQGLSLLYYLEFFAIFFLLIWRCRYGFGEMDESFYLVTPLRFIRGDRLLLHEWHLSQFASFTMIPEMWIYMQIARSTEGIILAFRYIYTILWCTSSLFLYFRTRIHHEYGARCASLFLMCYAPFGIMALSYNSLGILYLINSAIFLLCARQHKKVQFVVSGFFFAGAVLCCPYLVFVYLVYSLALGITKLRKKNPIIPTNQSKVTTCWLFFTLGAVILAILFLSTLFSGISFNQLPDALAGAFSDPHHAVFSFTEKSWEYFQEIIFSNAYFLRVLSIVVLMIALSFWKRNALWFCIVCAAVILYLRRFLQEYAYLNYLMFPATLIGLYVLTVTRQSVIRWVAVLWFIPGVLYTYCLNYSSNQNFFAVSSAASVSSTASFILMWMYCDELQLSGPSATTHKKFFTRGAYLAVLAFFVFQIRYEIPIRYQSVYWEAGLMKYEEQMHIDQGPEKGIIATVSKAERYNLLYREIQGIDKRRVLFLTEDIWMYLVNNNENAAYSGWLSWVTDITMNRLKKYYDLCPEKIPEVIFLWKESENLLASFDPNRFDIQPLESGDYLIHPIELSAGSWP